VSRLEAAELVRALRARGFGRATGVPCGHLAGPWELYDLARDLIPAADEGAALAIAAGWELGGSRGVVLCQNSGFGNLVNPLTSLVLPYRIPVTVFMTLRGWPDPGTDEPQHDVMGTTTPALLTTLGVPHAVLEGGRAQGRTGLSITALLDRSDAARREGLPFVGLVPRDAVGKVERGAAPVGAPAAPHRLTRASAVATLLDRVGHSLLVTTTGYLSRQAYHERDRDRTFYMQGSMGHASALGIGLAQARPDEPVVVLDGDGALLMHLGTGSTVGALKPANLVHVVIDNGCYESTGAQRTTSVHLDWAALGRGLGYRSVSVVEADRDIGPALDDALGARGPVLCVVRVTPTPDNVHPRPSSGIGLPDLTSRFRASLPDRVLAERPM